MTDDPMTDEWFYQHRGQTYGPMSLHEVRVAIRLRFALSTDLVRHRVTAGWAVAETFAELHALPREASKEQMSKKTRSNGFTLVELLVVIAIIGTLVGLLLPAVQSAREAGRRVSCSNIVRQITLAFLSHESARGYLPAGGWSARWIGDPNRGYGKQQPGGWLYNILPLIEHADLRQIGQGLTGAEQKAALSALVERPLSVSMCPSRRASQGFTGGFDSYFNADGPTSGRQARCDYAVNGGSTEIPEFPEAFSGPSTLADGDSSSFPWPSESNWNGLVWPRSIVKYKQIQDGLSKTYCIGEKALQPRYYLNGEDRGDDWCMWTGHQNDVTRSTHRSWAPRKDADSYGQGFGSAHASAFVMSMLDGSVHSVGYEIDPLIHELLGSRADGQRAALP